jgi:hypothetical protein
MAGSPGDYLFMGKITTFYKNLGWIVQSPALIREIRYQDSMRLPHVIRELHLANKYLLDYKTEEVGFRVSIIRKGE